MELLSVDTHEHGGWTVVAARGQLDVATAPMLRQRLIEAQYGGSTRLVLDLDALEFLDSFGLGVIIGAWKRARIHDGELVVVTRQPRIRKLFAITQVDQLLPVVDGLGDLVVD